MCKLKLLQPDAGLSGDLNVQDKHLQSQVSVTSSCRKVPMKTCTVTQRKC